MSLFFTYFEATSSLLPFHSSPFRVLFPLLHNSLPDTTVFPFFNLLYNAHFLPPPPLLAPLTIPPHTAFSVTAKQQTLSCSFVGLSPFMGIYPGPALSLKGSRGPHTIEFLTLMAYRSKNLDTPLGRPCRHYPPQYDPPFLFFYYLFSSWPLLALSGPYNCFTTTITTSVTTYIATITTITITCTITTKECCFYSSHGLC